MFYIKTQGKQQICSMEGIIYIYEQLGSQNSWHINLDSSLCLVKLGEYSSKKTAERVFKEIQDAMLDGSQLYVMPKDMQTGNVRGL